MKVRATLTIDVLTVDGELTYRVQSVGESGVVGADLIAMAKSAVNSAAGIVAVSIEAESKRREARA